jgi:hypothetical protein
MRTIPSVVVAALVALAVAPAAADPVLCQKTIAKQYTVLKKKTLKGVGKCLDKENLGTLPGPCPDAATAAKLTTTRQKVEAKVAATCSMADATALGFFPACNFGLTDDDSPADQACRTLPVTTPAELAACISCWKQSSFYAFLGVLYASHVEELCGVQPMSTSSVCTAGGCVVGSPYPEQRDLGDTGENDCQRAIGKAGIKYMLAREKIVEKCALTGAARATCIADPDVVALTGKAVAKKDAVIHDKCGNRDPVLAVPFCCKTVGNSCVAAATREDCETGGGQVQDNKTCGVGNTCDPVGGGQSITWWDVCESQYCGNTAAATLDDVIACVGKRADEYVDAMLCYQFGQNDWPCPSSPSGAFLD